MTSLDGYAHADYWNERYASRLKDERDSGLLDRSGGLANYDWYRSFDEIRAFLKTNLPPAQNGLRILHLGCGNSTLTYDLHEQNYREQISIDFSPVVIDAMRSKYADIDTQWEVMDVRKLEFPDEHFDVAIDKGTLDGMFHGSMWDPPDDVRKNISEYKAEVARTLKSGGRWLYITYKQPHFIIPLLVQAETWDIRVVKLHVDPGKFEYFGFVMTKHAESGCADGVE